MNFLLLCSKTDIASVSFFETLTNSNDRVIKVTEEAYTLTKEKENKIYLVISEKTHLYMDDLDISYYEQNLGVVFDFVIFLSRHSTQSEIKQKIISVHSIGNWGKAELGGKDESLVKTDPILARSLLLELHDKKPKKLKFELKQEATHHGSFLEKPALFVEIGSNRDAWENKDVAFFVSTTVVSVLSSYDKNKIKEENDWVEAVGYGGSHYCTKFNRATFDKKNKYCFGHIIPDYAIKDKQKLLLLIGQAKEKSNSSLVLDENLKELTF